MKTLIEVDRPVWGKVKEFATVNRMNLGQAVSTLLTEGLRHGRYSTKEDDDRVE